MIDIKLIRENPEMVKENIKKKFQDKKLPLVDEIYDLDILYRETKQQMDEKRAEKNKLSAEIGNLMREKKIDEANLVKEKVGTMGTEIDELTKKEEDLAIEIKNKMMMIPNIIADDVPIGASDEENVEEQVFGEPKVPEFEIPYHGQILEA